MAEVSKAFEVRPSQIHGLGAFACKTVAPGERVVRYNGRRISKEESLESCKSGNPFIFYLNETEDLDGNSEDNPARHLNHSCAPNCEAILIDGEIWIVALRQIAQDEELTFNYGYDLTDWRSYPCRCGMSCCVGYMVAEDFFPQLRQILGARGKDV
jgi:SET domain-containing protein